MSRVREWLASLFTPSIIVERRTFTSRPMKPAEIEAFDHAFQKMDEAFAEMDKAFKHIGAAK